MAVNGTRPRILLLIDRKGWAFHTIARALTQHLSDAFDFDILATADRPVIDDRQYDIIHVFLQTETYHHRFLTGHARVLKSVYSYHWREQGLTAMGLYETHLYEAHALIVPNVRLLRDLTELPTPVYLFSEGVDTAYFHPASVRRSGPLVVGWAGNPNRAIKRFSMLQEACDDYFPLQVATGNLSESEMVQFYQEVDVIACSSRAEGSPRPVLEGMACGCFPVSFDVGIVPEIVESGANGLIVRDESVGGLRNALLWCEDNLEHVRGAWKWNVEIIRATRDWSSTVRHMETVYRSLL